jgi:hypothetical protein
MSGDIEIDETAIEPVVEVWPRVIKLKHPVKLGDETVTQLEMQRGKIRDLKGIRLGDDVPTEHLMLVASRLCGQPVRVIEMLDSEDGGR